MELGHDELLMLYSVAGFLLLIVVVKRLSKMLSIGLVLLITWAIFYNNPTPTNIVKRAVNHSNLSSINVLNNPLEKLSNPSFGNDLKIVAKGFFKEIKNKAIESKDKVKKVISNKAKELK